MTRAQRQVQSTSVSDNPREVVRGTFSAPPIRSTT